MADEDVLPVELEKLEITPLLSQTKLLDIDLSVQFNPFYDGLKGDTFEQKRVISTTSTKINSSHCLGNKNYRRCRYHRPSDSTMDDLKRTTPIGLAISADCTRMSPNGVIKPTLKKCAPSIPGYGNRKVLLREPILKALHTCLYMQTKVQKKCIAFAVATQATSTKDGKLTTKGISDFRDLIDECHSLLSEDVDFSGRLNQSILSNRNFKNFATIQSQKHKIRSSKKPILNTAVVSLSTPENNSSNEDYLNPPAQMPWLQPAMLDSSICITNSQYRNINNLTPEPISNHARCNTTCSQQAGNTVGAASCDDVTIDELASYFDTFVHIPKKMSTMAEMMYI